MKERDNSVADSRCVVKVDKMFYACERPAVCHLCTTCMRCYRLAQVISSILFSLPRTLSLWWTRDRSKRSAVSKRGYAIVLDVQNRDHVTLLSYRSSLYRDAPFSVR